MLSRRTPSEDNCPAIISQLMRRARRPDAPSHRQNSTKENLDLTTTRRTHVRVCGTIDIKELNAGATRIVARQPELRAAIDTIVINIEGA